MIISNITLYASELCVWKCCTTYRSFKGIEKFISKALGFGCESVTEARLWPHGLLADQVYRQIGCRLDQLPPQKACCVLGKSWERVSRERGATGVFGYRLRFELPHALAQEARTVGLNLAPALSRAVDHAMELMGSELCNGARLGYLTCEKQHEGMAALEVILAPYSGAGAFVDLECLKRGPGSRRASRKLSRVVNHVMERCLIEEIDGAARRSAPSAMLALAAVSARARAVEALQSGDSLAIDGAIISFFDLPESDFLSQASSAYERLEALFKSYSALAETSPKRIKNQEAELERQLKDLDEKLARYIDRIYESVEERTIVRLIGTVASQLNVEKREDGLFPNVPAPLLAILANLLLAGRDADLIQMLRRADPLGPWLFAASATLGSELRQNLELAALAERVLVSFREENAYSLVRNCRQFHRKLRRFLSCELGRSRSELCEYRLEQIGKLRAIWILKRSLVAELTILRDAKVKMGSGLLDLAESQIKKSAIPSCVRSRSTDCEIKQNCVLDSSDPELSHRKSLLNQRRAQVGQIIQHKEMEKFIKGPSGMDPRSALDRVALKFLSLDHKSE